MRTGSIGGGGGGGGDHYDSSCSSPCQSPKNRLKFLCSYGGKILPRPSDGLLKYVGGDTRVLVVRRSIPFSELREKIQSMFRRCSVIKYQLASGDLDVLVTVTCDEDLAHMLDEYDRLDSLHPRSPSAASSPRFRLFLFPAPSSASASAPLSDHATVTLDQRFFDAINTVFPVSPRRPPIFTISAASSTVSSPSASIDGPGALVALRPTMHLTGGGGYASVSGGSGAATGGGGGAAAAGAAAAAAAAAGGGLLVVGGGGGGSGGSGGGSGSGSGGGMKRVQSTPDLDGAMHRVHSTPNLGGGLVALMGNNGGGAGPQHHHSPHPHHPPQQQHQYHPQHHFNRQPPMGLSAHVPPQMAGGGSPAWRPVPPAPPRHEGFGCRVPQMAQRGGFQYYGGGGGVSAGAGVSMVYGSPEDTSSVRTPSRSSSPFRAMPTREPIIWE